MRVLVVIPMFNKAELTNACIDHVRANAGVNHDILVVDDGSEAAFVHLGVKVVRLETNSGFTAAANEGLLYALEHGYEFVHLMNNDTEAKPDFLKLLIDHMDETPQCGIAGSARIHNTGTEHNLELCGADLIRGYQRMTSETEPLPPVIPCLWLPLCSATLRVSMLRYIGILDPRMRTWCSDNDICVRANFAGWGVHLIPASRVYHIHQATTGTSNSEGVMHDQQVLLQKISGYQYAEVMTHMPLDCESNVYGRLTFDTYKKEKS